MITDRRRPDPRPWGLITALVFAAAAGIVSIPLQVIVVRQNQAASEADVERAVDIAQQLDAQQRLADERAAAYREDTRVLVLAICDQVESIASQARLTVPPCPRVDTLPTALLPSPEPALSPSP